MDYVKTTLGLFESYLKQNLPSFSSFHPHYNQALAQMLLCGGKRFRPLLLLSVVDAYTPHMMLNALPVAMAIETLHTYSLIHDDLPAMDDADMRRNTPTLHVSFNEVTAILAGDALNTYAFEILSTAPLSSDTRIDLVKILSQCGGAGGMVLGQALDCHFSLLDGNSLTIEQLTLLHGLKTGRLIAGSLMMGGVIAGVPQAMIEKLERLGMAIGLAFQIRDDLIDQIYDSATAGKTTGRDDDKFSFVTLEGLEGAKQRFLRLGDEIRQEIAVLPEALGLRLDQAVKDYLILE